MAINFKISVVKDRIQTLKDILARNLLTDEENQAICDSIELMQIIQTIWIKYGD